MKKLKIISTGIGLPVNKVSHFSFDKLAEVTLGTSLKETKIENRYLSLHENSTDLGLIAANEALRKANLTIKDIDLMVVASATMDKALPFNAAMLNAKIQEYYKEKHYFQTMDIGASCLSFITALDTVSYMLQDKKYKKVLIVSADVSSYCLDFKNLKTNGIFGDGAAAVIVEKGDGLSNILASEFITLPEGVDYCQINSGGSRFHRRQGHEKHTDAVFEMNGKRLFSLALKFMPSFLNNLLAQANINLEDINVVVPHQASFQSLEHIFKVLNVAEKNYINIFPQFGNQIAASLPTALDFAINQKKIKRGDKVLLLGTGAGVTIGGIILQY